VQRFSAENWSIVTHGLMDCIVDNPKSSTSLLEIYLEFRIYGQVITVWMEFA